MKPPSFHSISAILTTDTAYHNVAATSDKRVEALVIGQ